MTEHADISPSSLNYRRQCHGYQPTHTDSAAAAEGSLLHAAIETGYHDALDTEQERLVALCQKFLARIEPEADEIHKELKVNIKLGKHTTFGTADRVVIRGTTLAYLIDFKFGRLGVPPAPENLQALAYAIGVFDQFPKVEMIQVWFLLPRRDETTTSTLLRSHLERYRGALGDLFDSITAPSPKLTPCGACQYCAQQGECPALAGSALLLGRQLDPLVVPDDADPKTMTPAVLDEVALPLARVLDSWCKSVKQRATELAMGGHDFEHHKLVGRRRAVTLDDVVEVYDLVSDIIPLPEFLKATKLSVAQLRSVAKSRAPRGKGKAAQDEITTRLASVLPEDEEAQTFYLRKK